MSTIDLDSAERELLIEMLEAAEKEKLHELHHAHSSEYKRLLRNRLTLIERLTSKLTHETTKV